MTDTTRSTESNVATPLLMMALELGSTSWTLGFTTRDARSPRIRRIRAGDMPALDKELMLAKARFALELDTVVASCYEAGRDGFWVHRWLEGRQVRNVVVDSASIEVNRRARHAKTDRLDVLKLLALLKRHRAGEAVWSVVRVPSPAAEADRQLTREIATVREDRKRVRFRIQSLLATQGIRLHVGRGFLHHLADAVTGDGRPLPAAFRERLTREWEHWHIVHLRLQRLKTTRDVAIAQSSDRVTAIARQLCRLRGVAETGAAVLSAELFATRTFTNGRQLGALVGLVPVPYRSDQRVTDQGISKAGRTELRRVAVQLAWCWLRWQPTSALARWYRERFEGAGSRSKRIGIVAVARKLLIALWRYVAHDKLPDGALVKT
jgi:transposase